MELQSPPTIDSKNYHADETLLDGRSIQLRSLRPDDREAIIEGMKHLSPESIFFRFFSVRHRLSDAEIEYFTQLDYVNHIALAAILLVDGKEVPAGIGRFVVINPDAEVKHAEVAFTVEDAYHGLGIGTHLFHHLEKLARSLGVSYFDADVHTANKKMIEVFHNLGLPITSSRDGSILHLELRLD